VRATVGASRSGAAPAARAGARAATGPCVLGLLAAIVTGPRGDGDHPWRGVERSVLGPRIAVFAVLVALLVGARTPAGRVSLAGLAAAARRRLAPLAPLAPLALVPAGARAGARAPGRAWTARRAGPGAALVLAALAPLAVSRAGQQSMVNDIGLYALLALGLNVVVGCAGLLDLGYVAFFAIGAYTTAYVTSPTAMPWHAPFTVNPFLAVPFAVAAAALAGVVLGGPTLRLGGDYLAIVTLGFGEIVQLLANNAGGITGGARGVFGVPPLSVSLPGLHYAWGLAPLPYYYLLLGLVTVVMVVFGRLEATPLGRAWAAVREDEFAAGLTGVRTVRAKLAAFAIGASVSGFAGVLYASKQFFNPDSFSLQASILVLTLVVFGGRGNRWGVLLGVVVLQGLAYALRGIVPPPDRYIYFGAVIVAMMALRPAGLVPAPVGRALPRSGPPVVPAQPGPAVPDPAVTT